MFAFIITIIIIFVLLLEAKLCLTDKGNILWVYSFLSGCMLVALYTEIPFMSRYFTTLILLMEKLRHRGISYMPAITN